MKRVKYYLTRLRHLQVGAMWATAGRIAKITRRPRLWIVLDMVLCSVRYGAGYVDYEEYEFYLLSAAERATYMTGTYYDRISARYNQREVRHLFADKSEFNPLFRRFLGRAYLDVRRSGPEELRAFLAEQRVVMLKHPESIHGWGVRRHESDGSDAESLHAELLGNGFTLVEAFIRQHPDMAALSPRSVNTLRVMTFLADDGQVHFLTSALKVGTGDVDNISSGGMYTVLDEDGVARHPAFDIHMQAYDRHPVTGAAIVGFQVPLYPQILATLTEAAKVVPQMRFIGWDVAVLPDGVAIVEGNWASGGFQMRPSLTGIRTGLKPAFQAVIDF